MANEFSIHLFDEPEEQVNIDNLLTALLRDQLANQNIIVNEIFEDMELREALKSLDNESLIEFFVNTTKFWNLIASERKKRSSENMDGLFGEIVTAEDALNAGGKEKRVESGCKINLKYLKEIGIEAGKVLFFRLTQPALENEVKPELYWTSDYFETRKGLRVEVVGEQREQSIVLVASLEAISKNGGLIQDVNDDNGLAVRQLENKSFNQTEALVKFKPKN